jgi:hypothetical protein
MAVGAGCDMMGNRGEVMGSVGGGAGCAFVNQTQVLGEGTSHLPTGNGSYDEIAPAAWAWLRGGCGRGSARWECLNGGSSVVVVCISGRGEGWSFTGSSGDARVLCDVCRWAVGSGRWWRIT